MSLGACRVSPSIPDTMCALVALAEVCGGSPDSEEVSLDTYVPSLLDVLCALVALAQFAELLRSWLRLHLAHTSGLAPSIVSVNK